MSIYNAMGSYIAVKKFNHMLEIDILRNSLQILLGVQKGVIFKDLGVQMMPRRPSV